MIALVLEPRQALQYQHSRQLRSNHQKLTLPNPTPGKTKLPASSYAKLRGKGTRIINTHIEDVN